MQNFTVVFAHGRESGPWGTKIRALAKIAENSGCRVISRDDTDTMDAEVRVTRMIDEAAALDGPVVLVGSSMGGYVAAVASAEVKPVGLFLMAPAIGLPNYEVQIPVPVARELEVVHGWDDDVVDSGPVVEFSRKHRAILHLVPAGHALIEQVDWLAQVFEMFLKRCMEFAGDNRHGRLMSTF